MKLYFKQKVFSLRQRTAITDQYGNLMFTAVGEIISLGRKMHIFDDSNNEVAFVQQLDHDPYDEKLPLEVSCHKRVVFSANQLHEKLLIIDEGLDDRVIELMKLFIIAEIMTKDPEHKVNEMYLNKEKDGSLKFAVLFDSGEWGRTEFIRSNYDLVVEKFKVELLSDDEPVINTQWAMSVLDKKI